YRSGRPTLGGAHHPVDLDASLDPLEVLPFDPTVPGQHLEAAGSYKQLPPSRSPVCSRTGEEAESKRPQERVRVHRLANLGPAANRPHIRRPALHFEPPGGTHSQVGYIVMRPPRKRM